MTRHKANLTRFPPPDKNFLVKVSDSSMSISRVRIEQVKSAKRARGRLIDLGCLIDVELDQLMTLDDKLIHSVNPLSSKLLMYKVEKPFSSLTDEQNLAKGHFFSRVLSMKTSIFENLWVTDSQRFVLL